MVLDEASPTAQDTFSVSDNVQDDHDVYSSSNPPSPSRSTIPPSIDFSRLSRPMPIFGPALGFNDEMLAKIIQTDASTMAAILQRPLTLPEWEATSFHMAKMQSYSSYGWPLGFAWGGWRAQRTMKEWRFPFYKPNLEKIGRERFDRFLVLRGEMARTAWHSLRFGLYMGLYGSFSKLLVTFYGVNVALTGQRVDERLKEFWDLLKTLDRDEIRRRRLTAGQNPSRQQLEEGFNNYRDMTLGDEQQVETPTPPREQGVWAQRQAAAARGELPGSTGLQSQSEGADSPQSTSPSFDFDDASPTAREEPQQTAKGGQEGAWDRIRRGNGAQPAGTSNQPARPLQGAQGDAWARLRGSGKAGGGSRGSGNEQDN